MKKRFTVRDHNAAVIPLKYVNVAECLTSPHAIWAMFHAVLDEKEFYIHEGMSHIAVIDLKTDEPVVRLLEIDLNEEKGNES